MARRWIPRFGIPQGPATGRPGRWLTLDLLKRVRDGNATARQVDGMGLELRIPELDYQVLTTRFPDLRSPDHEIKLRAWKKFMASTLSDPYRVRPRSHARRPAGVSGGGAQLLEQIRPDGDGPL